MQLKQVELHLQTPYASFFTISHDIGATSFSKLQDAHLNIS